jgi:hypothetical protein
VFECLQLNRGPRICKTILSVDGILDCPPERTYLVPWSRIAQIAFRRGDILVWTAGVQGLFIPRNAFADKGEARAFFYATQRAQRCDFALLTPPYPPGAPFFPAPSSVARPGQSPDVWPPPPVPDAGYPPHPTSWQATGSAGQDGRCAAWHKIRQRSTSAAAFLVGLLVATGTYVGRSSRARRPAIPDTVMMFVALGCIIGLFVTLIILVIALFQPGDS